MPDRGNSSRECKRGKPNWRFCSAPRLRQTFPPSLLSCLGSLCGWSQISPRRLRRQTSSASGACQWGPTSTPIRCHGGGSRGGSILWNDGCLTTVGPPVVRIRHGHSTNTVPRRRCAPSTCSCRSLLWNQSHGGRVRFRKRSTAGGS